MVPVSFDGENCLLQPPVGMETLIEPINAFQGHAEEGTPVCVTCWKMTTAELEEFQRTGRIWVVIRGTLIPPMVLTALKPIEKESVDGDSNVPC